MPSRSSQGGDPVCLWNNVIHHVHDFEHSFEQETRGARASIYSSIIYRFWEKIIARDQSKLTTSHELYYKLYRIGLILYSLNYYNQLQNGKSSSPAFHYYYSIIVRVRVRFAPFAPHTSFAQARCTDRTFHFSFSIFLLFAYFLSSSSLTWFDLLQQIHLRTLDCVCCSVFGGIDIYTFSELVSLACQQRLCSNIQNQK